MDTATDMQDTKGYRCGLDRPGLAEEQREYLLGPWPDGEFPCLTLGVRPDPAAVSLALFDQFELAARVLPTQRQIGSLLAQRVQQTRPDVVVLVVVDGLSYYDLPDTPEIQPCLVEGPTSTAQGYQAVIGRPSVSQRMFDLGYRTQMGYTFFDVATNALAGELYGHFGANQVTRVSTFEDCIHDLSGRKLNGAYVQISAPGLDGIVHRHLGRPPVKTYLSQLRRQFNSLVKTLRGTAGTVLACLTADHGILWRSELPDNPEFVDALPVDGQQALRYVAGSLMHPRARLSKHEGRTLSLLAWPYVARQFRHGEWGAHGGISAWESLVPLWVREVAS